MDPPVFVTGRAEKAREAERLGFRLERVDLDLAEIQALDPSDIVEWKAREAFRKLARPVIVEDSGLAIHAWEGFPGALVKWLEKSAGLEAIARMLDGFDDRSATATCAVAFFDGTHIVVGRGEISGKIAASPRGSGGFGWDSLFIPAGGDRTFAEMTDAEKDHVSHRRRAWDDLVRRLRGSRRRIELLMGAVEARKLTYEELRAMPQDGKRYELIEGETYMAPSPSVKHQTVIMNLLERLRSFVREKALGEVFVAPLDVVLNDQNVVQPDVFFVSRARAQAITPLFVNGAPDLVVEVLSPGNADFDRGAKRRAYAAAGVPEIWYADPRDDSVEVLCLGPDRAYAAVRRFSGDEVLVSESLPGFELPLRKLFA